MTLLHLPEGQFSIQWKHEHVEADLMAGPALRYSTVTTCLFLDGVTKENTAPLRTGVAKCSVQDNFAKSTGRKLSFERAISSLPRESRAIAWAWFWQIFRRAA